MSTTCTNADVLGLWPRHIENLRQLGQVIMRIEPAGFNMRWFTSSVVEGEVVAEAIPPKETRRALHECGTQCCLAGWAAAHRIGTLEGPAGESWHAYVFTNFGLDPLARSKTEQAFQFLFGGGNPNSLGATHARLRVLLRWLGEPAGTVLPDAWSINKAFQQENRNHA